MDPEIVCPQAPGKLEGAQGQSQGAEHGMRAKLPQKTPSNSHEQLPKAGRISLVNNCLSNIGIALQVPGVSLHSPLSGDS